MNRHSWLTACGVILTAAPLLVSSCGPSYPRERVTQAIIELCREEYQLEVRARLIGSTIVVFLPARRLFDEPITIGPETDVRLLNQQLRFSSEGVDQLQHVALAVRRVVLSTDARIEFYLVTIRDADGGQIELRWLGHVLDLKRFNALDISQGEFLKYRSVIHFRAVPTQVARRTVEQLFEDLRRRASLPTIARHFSPQANLKSLAPFLMRHLAPGRSPRHGTATLAEVKARQIEAGTVLVFARALVFSTDLPPVREEGYYFIAEVGDLRGMIQGVVSTALSVPPHPVFGRWVVPPEFAQYGAPERWTEDELFVEEIQLPAFLAEQIARRVRLDLGGQPGLTALAISGGYADDAFQFQFRLGQEAPAAAVPPTQRAVVPDPTTPHGLATVIAQTTARVVHSYGFKDFKQVAITDVASDVSWAVPEDQLPMYRRRQVPLIPSAPP